MIVFLKRPWLNAEGCPLIIRAAKREGGQDNEIEVSTEIDAHAFQIIET